jgi:prepilin peptidase CpaA
MRVWQGLFLLPIGLLAVLFDLRKDKIPNALILAGLVLGCFFQIVQARLLGMIVFLGGIGLPLILGAGIYYFRMMGAGDIKLLAVAGGFLGPQKAFYCTIVSLIVGSVLSLLLLLKRRNLKERILYFYSYMNRQQFGGWEPYLNEQDRGGRMHFAAAIFGALLLYIGGVY